MSRAKRRTPAEAYRLAIDIENRLAPAELAALPLLTGDLPWKTRRQIWRTRRLMRHGHASARAYRREELAPGATLYRGAPSADRLLIVFCGTAGRPMLPVAVFLQFIPEDAFDVLVLKDPTGKAYTAGIQGLGDDLRIGLDLLSEKAAFGRYRQIRTLGTSAGGAAALYAGVLLRVDVALSFGGRHPRLSRRAGSDERTGRFDELVAPLLPTCRTWAANFRAEGNPADRDGSVSLHESLPFCRDLPVPGISNHALLGELATEGSGWWRPERNRLQDLFARFLLGETPPEAQPSL